MNPKTCCHALTGHNTYCTESDRAVAALRVKLTRLSIEDRTYTIRVTFRDGFVLDLDDVDLDSVALDNADTPRATLGMETVKDNRIVRIPAALVATWEALCE